MLDDLDPVAILRSSVKTVEADLQRLGQHQWIDLRIDPPKPHLTPEHEKLRAILLSLRS